MKYARPMKYNKNPITGNRKLRQKGKKTFWSLFCPVVMILIAIILSNANGTGLFFIGSGQDNVSNLMIMARTVVMTLIAALALNTNLNSGRMDFSLGATGVLACLFAALIIPSVDTIAHIFTFILLSILFGMALGLLHSLILIKTKLPPIVISLGMCLIYEGIAKVVAVGNGFSGNVTLGSGSYTTSFFQEPIILIPLLLIVGIVMASALCYTRFGYNKLALVYNQKISVETGINEISHCIVSFILAGALIAIYQVMNSFGTASITINVNLASSGTVFKNFLPIFIGGILARYSNQIIGLFLATVGTVCLYNYGFDNSITATVSSLLNGFSVFAVLVYMVDKHKIINWIKMKRYVRKEKYLYPKEIGGKKDEE